MAQTEGSQAQAVLLVSMCGCKGRSVLQEQARDTQAATDCSTMNISTLNQRQSCPAMQCPRQLSGPGHPQPELDELSRSHQSGSAPA